MDGNSTDATLEILDRNRDDRRVVLTGADQGIADAFNRGLARATGDVVGFLNSDDWYASEESLAAVQRHLGGDRTIVCGAIELCTPDGRPRGGSGATRPGSGRHVHSPPRHLRTRRVDAGHGRLRHAVYRIAMDFDLFIRLRLAGAEFVPPSTRPSPTRTGTRGQRQRLPDAPGGAGIKNRHYGRGPRNYLHFVASHAVLKARSVLGGI